MIQPLVGNRAIRRATDESPRCSPRAGTARGESLFPVDHAAVGHHASCDPLTLIGRMQLLLRLNKLGPQSGALTRFPEGGGGGGGGGRGGGPRRRCGEVEHRLDPAEAVGDLTLLEVFRSPHQPVDEEFIRLWLE